MVSPGRGPFPLMFAFALELVCESGGKPGLAGWEPGPLPLVIRGLLLPVFELLLLALLDGGPPGPEENVDEFLGFCQAD